MIQDQIISNKIFTYLPPWYSSKMNHHLTDLLGILQEREKERDLLKDQLAKYQVTIKEERSFFFVWRKNNHLRKICQSCELKSFDSDS